MVCHARFVMSLRPMDTPTAPAQNLETAMPTLMELVLVECVSNSRGAAGNTFPNLVCNPARCKMRCVWGKLHHLFARRSARIFLQSLQMRFIDPVNEFEAERIDRLRNPSKYLGK